MSGKNETAPNGGPTKATTQDDSSTKSVSVESVLPYLNGVKPIKDGYMALCPFHGDTNASMKIWSNGGFKCFGCNEHGSLYHLARHLGVAVEKEGQKDTLKSFIPYLSKRLGINTLDVEKVAPRLNIRAKDGALTFPIVSPSDEFIAYVTHKPGDNVKYRLPEGVNPKGNLYGLDLALHVIKLNRLEEGIKGIRGNILLTEGCFDALGCLAHGIPAAAIMGGLNASEEAITEIYKGLFNAGFDRVVLCFDSDNAGRKFTLDYMRYFLSRPQIWTDVILLPEGFKDVNEGLQEEGPAFFEKLAPLPPIEAFLILEGIEEEIERGGLKGITRL